MNRNFRQSLIAFVTFIGGFYFFAEFILPQKIGTFEFGAYHQQISEAVQVVGVMAIGLGLINILWVHGTAIIRTRRGWINSLVLLAGLIVMFIFEGLDFMQSEASLELWKPVSELQLYSKDIAEKNAEEPSRAAERVLLMHGVIKKTSAQVFTPQEIPGDGELIAKLKLGDKLKTAGAEVDATAVFYRAGGGDEAAQKERHATLSRALTEMIVALRELASARYEGSSLRKGQRLLYEGFFVPLGAAMFSLLAFYIATAAYRTFRIRSWEAAIMMTAALLVMLGQIPHGPLYISEDLPAIRRWFMQYLNTPAFRAIYFGSIIAGLATAVRIWLSLERGIFSDGEGSNEGKGTA